MCKKSLLMMLLLALFAPWAANAQTLNEGFEGTTFPPDDWTAIHVSGSQQWTRSTGTGAAGSSAYAYRKDVNGGYNDYLITPLLVPAAGDELSFYLASQYAASYASTTLTIEVSTTTPTVDAFTDVLATYTSGSSGNFGTTGSTNWVNKTVDVSAYVGQQIYIAFHATDPGYNADVRIDNVSGVSLFVPACPKPTNLNVALTPGNGTVATLSWTSDADAWQICLNGDETNLISVPTNPYQLTGLTPETTYTAKVRANCGSEQSDWSNEVTFTPSNALQLTVNDGTTTNEYVPIYGTWVDDITKSQFIIPAESLADMAYGTITKMTFYGTNTGSDPTWGAAQFEVYMTETDETTLSALADYGTMTKVMNSAHLQIDGNQMVVEFDTPFEYSDGNLMIGFLQTATGSWSGCNWYGVTATGASIGGYGTSISQRNFLPKTTFAYLPGEAPTCLKPSTPEFARITFNSADVAWTPAGTETQWQLCINDDETNLILVSEPMYAMTGLTPETEYSVKVRAYCSADDQSSWSANATFTTLVACPAPTDMVISDITASSANVAWTGDGNFEMEYAIAGEGGSATFDFEDGTLQGWTNLIVDATGGQWLHSDNNLGGYDYTNFAHSGTGFAMSYSYVDNGGGAFNTNAYLVSPNRYQIGGNASLNFWYDFANETYPDHMEVCVATAANPTAADFTPIWSWDGAKRSNGLRSANGSRQRNNTRYQNWTEVTLDLNAYVGQNIWIAFHHVDYDMYEVWVDDVTVNTGSELTWIPVGTVTSPYAFGNLEAETTYMVRVRANCANGYDSQWLTGTFTTLPLCMVPTNLAISNIDKRSADLAWTANGDEEAWQISLNDGTNEQIIDVTATTYSFTGLTPETRYTVKVRAYCDADLQSAWSSPTAFTTLVACPAPTGLAISNITNVSAVATWTYEGDVELEYAVDPWLHYDNGVYYGGIGTGGSDVYWAIMLPPTMLINEPLSKVAVYEDSGYNTEPLTIMVYSGGDTAPGTLLYEETVNTEAADDFHEITLAEPVTFDATQNLWIVCKEYGTYPAQGCVNTGDANGRWISLDGTAWEDVATYLDYTWMIRAGLGDATIDWVAVNNPASPQTIAGLTPETTYQVRLRAVCGGIDGESVWVNTSFTTDVACPAPTALAATPYANSAVLSWEGISESYTVSYRTAAYTEGVSEEFATTSAPTGWTRSNTLLTDDVLNGTTPIASYSGGWTFGTGNGVFDSHARVNIWGSSCKYWLVTPALEVPAGAEFSFDLALTAYSGTVSAPATNGTDDRFVVLVSTDDKATWSILRQWDNAGSEYVYNNIANTATGENVSFDFSAYAGQTVYVAFYGESTSSNADNNLHIDNVAIGTAIPAGEWMTVDADEATATLTGLTPETKYEWKVQGDCGEFGMSEESAIMSFTTTNDACPVPTNLTVDAETLTATTADLSWAGSPDVESFTVRYRAPEHAADGGLYEPFGTTIPSGWTMYTGLLSDVMDDPTALVSANYGWSFGPYNSIFDDHARVNIYSEVKRWLVMPEVTVPTGADLTFDMALTKYSGDLQPVVDTLQQDDRFIVLISTDNLQTWTILREWNNSGSSDVYNTIATEGEAVSINLSAYAGQTVRIAFYGESTNPSDMANTGGDNNLHIDNVLIGTLIPATDWMTVEGITDMNVTLTGLTPETPYEAQVKAGCSEAENPWSNTVNFTTLEQTTITQSYELTEGWNWVSFNIVADPVELLDMVKAALGDNALQIESYLDGGTEYLGDGEWFGDLDEVGFDNKQMYLIEVETACEFELEGMPADPSGIEITISPGWNWIGYPYSEEVTISDLFSAFEASEEDVIESLLGQSMYLDGEWVDAGLVTLIPGQGFMYFYNGEEEQTLVYQIPAKSRAASVIPVHGVKPVVFRSDALVKTAKVSGIRDIKKTSK